MRTNGDWLDSDPFLEVCVCRVIGILSLEHLFPAKGVHESSSTWEVSLRPYESSIVVEHTSTRGATDHQAELDPLFDILLSADLNL
jgi:hypothetical protein